MQRNGNSRAGIFRGVKGGIVVGSGGGGVGGGGGSTFDVLKNCSSLTAS